MKAGPYAEQGKAIAAADKDTIRERWLYGLRVLRDPDAFTPGSTQLKPRTADFLIKVATACGDKLSEREIRYRLRCARAYQYESQIRQASAEFRTWWGLIGADFPAFEAEPGEPVADHRTAAERRRERNRDMAQAHAIADEQLALFPDDRFDLTTQVQDLVAYTAEMEGLTARFVARDRDRRAYVDALIAAVDGDLSATWQEAEAALRHGSAAHLRVVAA